MTDRTIECKNILKEFLETWPLERVEIMTLEEYISNGSYDTFCYWVEWKTQKLGNINGTDAIKFGIYNRKSGKKRMTGYSDSNYSWLKSFGPDRDEAFRLIRSEICFIIKAALSGNFDEIDDYYLYNFAKWKIAFLYSNERLIPIFKREVLEKIAKFYGHIVNSQTSVSDIQMILIENKPSHLSIYDHTRKLYDKFGRDKIEKDRRIKRRKATDGKNTEPQKRSGSDSYIANQKHNILQNKLRDFLISKYGKRNVHLEEDFVDIKVTLPNMTIYYEVKSDSYASDCIRSALGQVLSYVHFGNSSPLESSIVVVGQYSPNKSDSAFINYVKKQLKVSFEYQHLSIDELHLFSFHCCH